MIAMRRLRWKISLVAVLALLQHSLMPALMPARASAGASSADWIEVCAGGKLQLIQAPAHRVDGATTDGGPGNAAGKTLDDCSFCSHHGTAAVRSESGRALPAMAVHRTTPDLAFDAPDPHFAWAAEHARGPPPSLN
jgi:hypothetical protein